MQENILPDFIELVLLLLPAITTVFIAVWDYITTVYGVVYGGGLEINPLAKKLLDDGKLVELMKWKAFHALLNLFVYVIGLVFYILGKVKEIDAVKWLGAWLLILFYISYFVGLIVITLNIVGIASILTG